MSGWIWLDYRRFVRQCQHKPKSIWVLKNSILLLFPELFLFMVLSQKWFVSFQTYLSLWILYEKIYRVCVHVFVCFLISNMDHSCLKKIVSNRISKIIYSYIRFIDLWTGGITGSFVLLAPIKFLENPSGLRLSL